jgi:hypothetical protein
VPRLLSCFFQFTYDSLGPWKLFRFSIFPAQKKRPMLQNRPLNVNKLPPTVFLKLAEQHARCALS